MIGAPGNGLAMTETERSESDDRTPSDPPEDPKVHPAPPSNPERDEDAVRRGEERLDQVSGN